MYSGRFYCQKGKQQRRVENIYFCAVIAKSAALPSNLRNKKLAEP
jgi:hypothetical protein